MKHFYFELMDVFMPPPVAEAATFCAVEGEAVNASSTRPASTPQL